MSTLIIGFLLVFGVFFNSFESGSLSQYLQWHSIILVIGGSLGILVLSNPPGVLKSLFKALLSFFKPDDTLSVYEHELRSLSTNKEQGAKSKNKLIAYAAELWEQGIDPELFVALLSQKKRELEHRQIDAVQALKNLSKYPPALGMVGTVMGMVALFQGLDSNKNNIGANLSMAMTATFYGLILTNAIVSPLSDRLQVKQVHDANTNQGVYELLLLINRGESSSFIDEEIRERAA